MGKLFRIGHYVHSSNAVIGDVESRDGEGLSIQVRHDARFAVDLSDSRRQIRRDQPGHPAQDRPRDLFATMNQVWKRWGFPAAIGMKNSIA